MQGPEVLIPIIFLAGIAGVLITYITSRHKERMTMIERGMASEEIKALYSRDTSRRDPISSLKWGILFLFIGLAILLGNYLRAQFHVEEGVYFGLICLMAGIGLLLFYVIASKKTQQV
jgi:hypothetical protein